MFSLPLLTVTPGSDAAVYQPVTAWPPQIVLPLVFA